MVSAKLACVSYHFVYESFANLGATIAAFMPNVILQSTLNASSRIIIRVVRVTWEASSALFCVKGRKVLQILVDLDQALYSFFWHKTLKLLNLAFQ